MSVGTIHHSFKYAQITSFAKGYIIVSLVQHVLEYWKKKNDVKVSELSFKDTCFQDAKFSDLNQNDR